MLVQISRTSILLVVALLVGCGNNDVTPPPSDTTAPAAVADLTVSIWGDSLLQLVWTAPGDDGANGQASTYDLRIAPTPLNGNDWESADSVGELPSPDPAGTVEVLQIPNPAPNDAQYFALRTADEVPNWSTWSNTALAPANLPPVTRFVGGPRDSSRVANHAGFSYLGTDPDGTVVGFDYLLRTHPRSVATIDQVPTALPAADDPLWTRTSEYGIALVLLADTLRADPRGDIGAGEFDRWHTLFVRAVDNFGAVDPNPAFVRFDAFTTAPRIWLLPPARKGVVDTVSTDVVLRWDGSDAIGDGSPPDLAPVEARWTLVPAQVDTTGTPVGFPEALYDLAEQMWQPWHDWAAPDSSGRRAVLQNLTPNAAYAFAVQGRDDGGAVTPQFVRDVPNASNYMVFVVRSGP